MRYQWGVFHADLEPAVGSEQSGKRPVVVVSREVSNQLLPVVTVLPVTSRKPGRRVYPNETRLAAGAGGLRRESLVLAHQVRTLSKLRLSTADGYLDTEADRLAIQSALRFHLEL